MDLDDVLRQLGAYGRYQVMVYMAISLFDNIPSIIHMSVMAFLGYEPDHRCKIPPGTNMSDAIPTTVSDNGKLVYDKCKMYVYDNGTGTFSNQTTTCVNGWWYERDPVHSSVVTEWDLVCSKNVLPEMSVMVFNFGVMFGALLFGFTSDKFGRKKTFIFALLTQVVVGSLVSASHNFYLFTALRFLVGALEQGVNITGYIMATELFPPKQRTLFGVAHEYIWALGGAFLPILAYIFRDWRHLQLAISIPSILGIALIWIIPESIVWLLAKGRVQEAEAVLHKAAKCNKVTLPPNPLSDVTTQPMINEEKSKQSSSRKTTYTVIDLYRTPNIRKITMCLSMLWAINTMVYYGLSYNTPNLYGDMYINFFIGQMVELPSVAFTMFVIYRYGRRWPLCLFHIFAGIVCVVAPFIPAHTEAGTDLKWVQVTLAMLGKFGINSSFTIIYIYGPEVYPTVVRNTGSSYVSMFGRFGGILYPYINYLSKVQVGAIGKQLPLIIFGVMSVGGGFLALPLPETRHRPLAETVDDLEHYDEFCKRKQREPASPTQQDNGNVMVNGKDDDTKL